MAEYQLRSVDPVLWHQFKTRILAEHTTIKAKLLELVQQYVDSAPEKK